MITLEYKSILACFFKEEVFNSKKLSEIDPQDINRKKLTCYLWKLKPGLQEPQQPVERRVALVSSIVVERRHCALQVSSVALLQENKET